jgi:hypothetical protein
MSTRLINKFHKTAHDLNIDRMLTEANGETWQLDDRQQQKLTKVALKARPHIQNRLEQVNR